MKKLIKEKDYVYYFSFYGEIPFESLEELIQDAKEKGWNGLDTTEYEHNGNVYYYRNRLETDEEYNGRIYKEELDKKNREELIREFEIEDIEIQEKISRVLSKWIFEPRSVINVNELYETLNLPLGAIQTRSNYALDEVNSLIITVNNKQYVINL